MPRLTVITVVKDDPVGLTHTLQSVAVQTADCSLWELVIVDSSTPSLENLTQLSPISQISYRWAAPEGIYSAMNIGIGMAGGEYLYFLNAGDTFASASVIQQILDSLQEQPPEWLYGRVVFLSQAGEELLEPPWNYWAEKKRYFARGLFPAHQGTVMKRELLQRLGGFDLSYEIASDYQLMLKASVSSDPLVVDLPIAEFKQGGLSSTKWSTAIREFHRARREIFQPAGTARVVEIMDTVADFIRSASARTLRRLGRG